METNGSHRKSVVLLRIPRRRMGSRTLLRYPQQTWIDFIECVGMMQHINLIVK